MVSAGGEAVLFGLELDLGGLARRARRLDALAGGLERGDRVAHFDADLERSRSRAAASAR